MEPIIHIVDYPILYAVGNYNESIQQKEWTKTLDKFTNIVIRQRLGDNKEIHKSKTL